MFNFILLAMHHSMTIKFGISTSTKIVMTFCAMSIIEIEFYVKSIQPQGKPSVELLWRIWMQVLPIVMIVLSFESVSHETVGTTKSIDNF